MEFAADGTPLTPLKQFTAKIADREETAEFRADIRDSGFVGMFPILYTAAGVPDTHWVPRIKDAVCSEYGANEWPDIVALVKYPTYYHRNSAQPAHKDHKAALKSFIASHTRTMTKLVDLDETVL
jgi:hypothetical protein